MASVFFIENVTWTCVNCVKSKIEPFYVLVDKCEQRNYREMRSILSAENLCIHESAVASTGTVVWFSVVRCVFYSKYDGCSSFGLRQR